jgi:cell wall-associated NlpC family hydrolase
MFAVVLAASIAAPRGAGADPLSDKRAEAARLSAQIAALGDKESALAERYNRAALRAHQVDTKVAQAKAALAKTTDEITAARSRVRSVAVDAYVRGSTDLPLAQLSRGTDPALAPTYRRAVTSRSTDAIDALRVTTLDLQEQRGQLAAAQQEARGAVKEITSRRNEVLKVEGQLNSTLAQVKGKVAELVAQAEAARRAADAARAAARIRSARNASPSPSSFGAAPARRAGAGAAVAEALRQVGKPYQWGADGPDSFDCSGLTLFAWRAGGVDLPHYTGAQYSATTHIAISELEPGDLVYNRSMGHMGMYIGNGNMVEAPHTGANVRVIPLRSDMDLASRP